MQQMTRRIVSGARESHALAVAEADGLQMLAHVADAGAEFAGRLGVFRIMLKQMCVRNQHRSATTGIGDDWRVLPLESIDVLPCQSPGAFNIARVRMKGTATNLGVGRSRFAAVNFQRSRRRLVDSLEESFRHATFEEQNWSAGSADARSACILRAVRRHLACDYYPVATAPGTDTRSLKQSQSKLKPG